jgi:hypothetical protein
LLIIVPIENTMDQGPCEHGVEPVEGFLVVKTSNGLFNIQEGKLLLHDMLLQAQSSSVIK